MAVVTTLVLATEGTTATIEKGDDAAWHYPNEVTFGAGSDIGATEATSATLDLIRAANPDFFLALGDLSLSNLEPETAWCDYITARLGPDIPTEWLWATTRMTMGPMDGSAPSPRAYRIEWAWSECIPSNTISMSPAL